MDDLFEGKGNIFIDDKLKFEGTFSKGKLQGFGREISAEFDYEGDFKDGVKNGKGVMKHKNGDIYEGSFRNDVKYGNGVYRFKDGEIYEGEFKDDGFEGHGVMRFEGVEIKGNFKRGKLDGEGEIIRNKEKIKGNG